MQNSGRPLAPSAGIWTVAAYLLVFAFSGQVFAKPAGCPCSPCTCGTCHCGGGGGSGGKGGKHRHDHAGSAGAGMSVDLGGVGQRHREADPFAVGGGQPSTAHTQEKHVATTRKHEKESATAIDPFRNVRLTGAPAKALAQGDDESKAAPR